MKKSTIFIKFILPLLVLVLHPFIWNHLHPYVAIVTDIAAVYFLGTNIYKTINTNETPE